MDNRRADQQRVLGDQTGEQVIIRPVLDPQKENEGLLAQGINALVVAVEQIGP
jgi:hypothetical protein